MSDNNIEELKSRIAELEAENLSLIEEAEQVLQVRIIDEKLSDEKTEIDILNTFTESLATYNSFIYVAYYKFNNNMLLRVSDYSLSDQLELQQENIPYTSEIKSRLESLDGYISLTPVPGEIKNFLPLGEMFSDAYISPVYLSKELKGLLFIANNDEQANILNNHVTSITMPISVLEQRLTEYAVLNHLENEVKLRTQELQADIEKRKITESKLSLHVQQTPLGVIEWNTAFEVTAWNPAAEKIFGYTESEAIGKHATEIILPGMERIIVDQIWQELLTQKGGTRSTNQNKTKAQQLIDCEWYNTPLVNKNNEVIGVASLVQDVTEQHRQQTLLIEAKEEADKANRAKSNFLAKMSHELRTPMHGVLSFASFGISKSKEMENKKIPFYFKQIEDSGKRLMRLLNDLLDLSKLEAGKVKLDFIEQSFTDVIETVIQEQQLRLDEKEVAIIWQDRANDVRFEFDKPTMIQVITNLFSNAIKFNNTGQPIHISLAPKRLEDDKVEYCFSMRDHGIGIPDDELQLVFQPFDQSSRTTHMTGSTGLGLPICQEIIEAHKGKIWAENHPEGGAIFSFCVPVKHVDL